jgi:hypothetical protein
MTPFMRGDAVAVGFHEKPRIREAGDDVSTTWQAMVSRETGPTAQSSAGARLIRAIAAFDARVGYFA